MELLPFRSFFFAPTDAPPPPRRGERYLGFNCSNSEGLSTVALLDERTTIEKSVNRWDHVFIPGSFQKAGDEGFPP